MLIFGKKWSRLWPILPLIVIALILVFIPGNWPEYRAYTYVAVVLLLVLNLILVGREINGLWVGVFIDNRNRISLSKLQMGAWTIVVLSALATAAAFNAATDMYQGNAVTAFSVVIPGELLLAMGISATSLVGAPMLLSVKAQEDPTAQAVADSQARFGTTGTGKVMTRAKPQDASWVDLVTGEELGNASSPDLGKIQQVLVTLLLLGIYTAYIYALFAGTAEKITHLPILDQSFVWLMGISHASYLVYKAAPHTASGDANNLPAGGANGGNPNPAPGAGGAANPPKPKPGNGQ